MWTVASYVLRQKLAGRKRYPLVLMLEPLFRCNLACAGCGKIQYPAHILKKDLTPEQCFQAVEECGAPMVSIPGGEPLMHPQIDKIVEGRLNKFYEEAVLLDQPFVKEEKKTVGELITEKIAKTGEKVSIRRFTRYKMGEGLEKRGDDFESEVAKLAGE